MISRQMIIPLYKCINSKGSLLLTKNCAKFATLQNTFRQFSVNPFIDFKTCFFFTNAKLISKRYKPQASFSFVEIPRYSFSLHAVDDCRRTKPISKWAPRLVYWTTLIMLRDFVNPFFLICWEKNHSLGRPFAGYNIYFVWFNL